MSTTVKPSNPTLLFMLHELPSLVAISHSKIMNTEQRCVNMVHETERYAQYTVQFKYGTEMIFWQLLDIWHFSLILGAFSNGLQFPLMKDRLPSFCIQSAVINHFRFHNVTSNHYTECYNTISELHSCIGTTKPSVASWLSTSMNFNPLQSTVKCRNVLVKHKNKTVFSNKVTPKHNKQYKSTSMNSIH